MRSTVELFWQIRKKPTAAASSPALSIVRGFARHRAVIDPDSEISSEDLLPARYSRVTPYLYSPAQIAALMAAARTRTPPLRAATVETMIGLLAAMGVRIGETPALDRADVNLDDGVLHIRLAKAQRQREASLHRAPPRHSASMRGYATVADPGR